MLEKFDALVQGRSVSLLRNQDCMLLLQLLTSGSRQLPKVLMTCHVYKTILLYHPLSKIVHQRVCGWLLRSCVEQVYRSPVRLFPSGFQRREKDIRKRLHLQCLLSQVLKLPLLSPDASFWSDRDCVYWLMMLNLLLIENPNAALAQAREIYSRFTGCESKKLEVLVLNFQNILPFLSKDPGDLKHVHYWKLQQNLLEFPLWLWFDRVASTSPVNAAKVLKHISLNGPFRPSRYYYLSTLALLISYANSGDPISTPSGQTLSRAHFVAWWIDECLAVNVDISLTILKWLSNILKRPEDSRFK